MLQTELSRVQIGELIELWIFNERNRAIMKRRLLDGVTFKELECEFALSERQIKKIVRVGKERIFAKSNLWSL